MSALLWARLREVSLRLDRLYQPIAAKRGLSIAGLMVLQVLYDEPYRAWTVTELCVEAGLVVTSSTPFLDGLVDRGYIVRTRSNPRDGRSVIIALTEKAKREEEAICNELLEVQRLVEATFAQTTHGIRTLLNGLEEVSRIHNLPVKHTTA